MNWAVDDHIRAVAYANRETVGRFKVYGPYEVGSKEHAFWLSRYDDFIKVASSPSLIEARRGRAKTYTVAPHDAKGGAA